MLRAKEAIEPPVDTAGLNTFRDRSKAKSGSASSGTAEKSRLSHNR
ncbi:MAG TPA: hypothetical protein VKA41_03970 [Solirubrobacterales bacterium]|nr:hypothetical protein [Solirubrobacterales bacterium]